MPENMLERFAGRHRKAGKNVPQCAPVHAAFRPLEFLIRQPNVIGKEA